MTTAKIGEIAGLCIVSRFLNAVFPGRLGAFHFLLGFFFAGAGVLRASDALNVRSEVGPGPYFVGQGFELRIGVVAGSQRPKIDPPRIAGARTWLIGTERRPITASRIGSVVAHESLLLTRFRVVPERAGTLEIPAVPVQLENRSGRSQARSVSIQILPLLGRPAEFFGGVGRFELHAEASPQVVRVGQELELRIRVTGPAAWGMTDRPNLGRYERLGLGLRIEPKPDETTDEPASRSFVYRLRPTHAGEAVLPPVAIAAFDPSVSRYITRVTTGLSIRVVAVPSFDPATLSTNQTPSTISRPALMIAVIISLLAVSFALLRASSALRLRLARPRPSGPYLARRFARQTARYLGALSVEREELPANPGGRVELLSFDGPEFDGNVFLPSQWYSHSKPMIVRARSPEILQSAARRIYERLASYLLVATGQSLGVLTPDEARQGIADVTGSQDLAAQAGTLTRRCDVILYGNVTEHPAKVLCELLDDARRLFEALGRVRYLPEVGPSVQP
jgi:hypothetical protein